MKALLALLLLLTACGGRVEIVDEPEADAGASSSSDAGARAPGDARNAKQKEQTK